MIEVNSNGEATVNLDYRDTVYDALAASNRTARATYQLVSRLFDLVVWGFIMVGCAFILKGK